jgi:hypothetical protein
MRFITYISTVAIAAITQGCGKTDDVAILSNTAQSTLSEETETGENNQETQTESSRDGCDQKIEAVTENRHKCVSSSHASVAAVEGNKIGLESPRVQKPQTEVEQLVQTEEPKDLEQATQEDRGSNTLTQNDTHEAEDNFEHDGEKSNEYLTVRANLRKAETNVYVPDNTAVDRLQNHIKGLKKTETDDRSAPDLRIFVEENWKF